MFTTERLPSPYTLRITPHSPQKLSRLISISFLIFVHKKRLAQIKNRLNSPR